MAGLKMYRELAPWFHLITAPKDYDDEAAAIASAFDEIAARPVRTVLELGSGGGNNASHLKARYALTLVDLSEEMLALSKTINPECEHVAGDMRTVRLGRKFDAVFIHDAICYMTTQEDLAAAIATAAAHLEPGGVAVFHPDETTETFNPTTSSGGHDGDDGRAMRYLQWVHPAEGSTYRTSYVYMLKEPAKPVRIETEEHLLGLFPAAAWLGLIRGAGLEPDRRPSYVTGPQYNADLFAGLLTK